MWTKEEEKHLLGDPDGDCIVYLHEVEIEKIITKYKQLKKDIKK